MGAPDAATGTNPVSSSSTVTVRIKLLLYAYVGRENLRGVPRTSQEVATQYNRCLSRHKLYPAKQGKSISSLEIADGWLVERADQKQCGDDQQKNAEEFHLLSAEGEKCE